MFFVPMECRGFWSVRGRPLLSVFAFFDLVDVQCPARRPVPYEGVLLSSLLLLLWWFWLGLWFSRHRSPRHWDPIDLQAPSSRFGHESA